MLNKPLVVCGQTARRVAEHWHDLTPEVNGLRNGPRLSYAFITRESESGRNTTNAVIANSPKKRWLKPSPRQCSRSGCKD